MANIIVWADIPVADMDRARAFYSAVLQVPVELMPGMDGVALPVTDDQAQRGLRPRQARDGRAGCGCRADRLPRRQRRHPGHGRADRRGRRHHPAAARRHGRDGGVSSDSSSTPRATGWASTTRTRCRTRRSHTGNRRGRRLVSRRPASAIGWAASSTGSGGSAAGARRHTHRAAAPTHGWSSFACAATLFWPGALIFGFPGVMAAHWQQQFGVGKGAIGNVLFFSLAGLGVLNVLSPRLPVRLHPPRPYRGRHGHLRAQPAHRRLGDAAVAALPLGLRLGLLVGAALRTRRDAAAAVGTEAARTRFGGGQHDLRARRRPDDADASGGC